MEGRHCICSQTWWLLALLFAWKSHWSPSEVWPMGPSHRSHCEGRHSFQHVRPALPVGMGERKDCPACLLHWLPTQVVLSETSRLQAPGEHQTLPPFLLAHVLQTYQNWEAIRPWQRQKALRSGSFCSGTPHCTVPSWAQASLLPQLPE